MGKGKGRTFSSSQRQSAKVKAGKLESQKPRKPETQRARKPKSQNTGPLDSNAKLEEVETHLAKGTDKDELSGILDIMELDDAVDTVDDLSENEDGESDDPRPRRDDEILQLAKRNAGRAKALEDTSMERDMTEEVEEVDQRPKSRWFITTCRYCGDIYRFRSDQPQPSTCGRPQCITRFEESSRRIETAPAVT